MAYKKKLYIIVKVVIAGSVQTKQERLCEEVKGLASKVNQRKFEVSHSFA